MSEYTILIYDCDGPRVVLHHIVYLLEFATFEVNSGQSDR